jgi:branched-chain amino acid transport system substrate-binding protein
MEALKSVRQRIRLGLLLAAASLMAGCSEPDPISVGFVASLTGRAGDLGEASRNAVQLAVDEINRAGGISGRKLSLLVRDDENNPDVAAHVVRDLHAANAVAVIGPNNSAIAVGMKPVLDELKLVGISPTVSSLVFAGIDDYFFRVNWTTRDNAAAYARQYFDRGIKTFSVAIDNDNRVFSESWYKEFSAAYEALGGRVMAAEYFSSSTGRAFGDTVQLLLAEKPDALLLVANSVDTAQLAQQIRKVDQKILLVASEWAATERLLILGGAMIEGLELVQSYDRNDRSERYAVFRKAYWDRFQSEPGYSSVAAYDSALVLFKALAQQQRGQSLKRALLSLGAVQGLQQDIHFDQFGDARRRAFFVVVRQGKFETL